MMQVCQEALLTLQKFRTGGKQAVVVQHVQVSQGGQAVIAEARNPMRKGHSEEPIVAQNRVKEGSRDVRTAICALKGSRTFIPYL